MRLSSSVGSGLMAVAASSALLLPACNNQTSTPGAASEALKPEHSASATATVAKAPVGIMEQQDKNLSVISAAFQKFHNDTGGWPNGDGVWFEDKAGQVDATEFGTNDTALFTKPASIAACSAEVTKACWAGPYLEGKSLADAAYLDKSGHPYMVTLMRPFDGNGGGASTAKDGAVVVWSRGVDGKDSVGCTDGACSRDDKKIALGQSSLAGADDVVALVGAAR